MTKKRLAIIANILVIMLEIVAFCVSSAGFGWARLAYYTVLSNLVAAVSSVIFLIAGEKPVSRTLRVLSACMLTMTFCVVIFVLIPMGVDPVTLLFKGSGLFHHLLCPILSVMSYIFLEPHDTGRTAILVPAGVTLLYGIVMLALNGLRIVDGPYPFFRVYHQSALATVIWILALLLLIMGIAFGIRWAAKRADKAKQTIL